MKRLHYTLISTKDFFVKYITWFILILFQSYFEFSVCQRGIDWRKVFLIPRISTIESYTRSFQYKISNNALFLNKRLFKFGVIESPACSFCGQVDESPIHFFGQCSVTVATTVEETTEMADSIFCFTRSDFGECPFRLYANYLRQWNYC